MFHVNAEGLILRKFECHLTYDGARAAEVEQYGKDLDWKFSKIDGDVLMGQKVYCYLTSYDTDGAELLRRAKHIAIHTEPILRLKVEEIIYDTRTGLNNV